MRPLKISWWVLGGFQGVSAVLRGFRVFYENRMMHFKVFQGVSKGLGGILAVSGEIQWVQGGLQKGIWRFQWRFREIKRVSEDQGAFRGFQGIQGISGWLQKVSGALESVSERP